MKNIKTRVLKINYILIILLILICSVSTSYADDVDNDEFNETKIEEIQSNIIDVASSNVIEEPIVNSRRCVIYDRISKTVIWGKNENAKSAMASTTKIMTATVVLENADLNEEVTVSSKAGATGGSRLGLKKRRQSYGK